MANGPRTAQEILAPTGFPGYTRVECLEATSPLPLFPSVLRSRKEPASKEAKIKRSRTAHGETDCP